MADSKAPDSAGIEAVHELPHDIYSGLNVSTRAEPAGYFVGNGADPPIIAPPASFPAQDNMRRLKRTIVWLIVAVILLIALTVVLGAVLGTKLADETAAPTVTVTASPTTNPNPTPSGSPTASPSSIRKIAALSVTGWRSGSEFSIRLFYQGDDTYLRIIGFESGNSSWSAPSTIVQAKPGTPIAATSFNANAFFSNANTDYHQIELFYVDNSNNIQEWDFQDSYSGFSGSISTYSFKIGAFSRMVTYWPSIIFQDDSYMLQEIQYNTSTTGSTGGWSQSAVNVNGLNNSGLAEVPLTANGNFGVSVFYNRNDQNLFDLARNQSVGGWTPGTLSLPILSATSIGAFAVPRYSSTTYIMNTYILWQDASGILKMSWQDDDSGWKGPSTFLALSGADNGTAIACLTPNAWPLSNLLAQYDMSRCYFQAGGMLKEVLYNGSDWSLIGNVPIS